MQTQGHVQDHVQDHVMTTAENGALQPQGVERRGLPARRRGWERRARAPPSAGAQGLLSLSFQASSSRDTQGAALCYGHPRTQTVRTVVLHDVAGSFRTRSACQPALATSSLTLTFARGLRFLFAHMFWSGTGSFSLGKRL